LLLASAFPKFDLAGFAWICPALLLLAARGQSGWDAFRAGYVGGLAFWLASLYWLLFMPVTGLPILGWIALSAYVAVFFGVWTWLVSGFKFQASNWSARLRWSLSGAAIWVALEWVRGWLFSGFPWSFLGASQYQLVPLIQIASLTGVYGVSFLVVWFSLAIYSAGEMIYRHPSKRQVWQAEMVVPLAAIVLLFVGGLFWMNRKQSSVETMLRIVAVQPSVPQTLIWSPTEDEKRFTELLAVSQQAMTNHPDLLLWPESAVPMFDGVYDLISRFAQTNHVGIIFNGDDATFRPNATNYFNSAFLVRPDGNFASVYHKQKLVIFGEYIPLVRWLPFLKWFTPITDGWTAGDQPGVFELDWLGQKESEPVITLNQDSSNAPARCAVQVSPLICFEDVFPGVARRAANRDTDFLVNLTNDGWFSESAEQWQHLANSVFRAVENGLPLVRAANNGITGWIDEHGRVREIFRTAAGSEYGPGPLLMEIPLRPSTEAHAETFYHRHGNWFAWGCMGITVMMLVARRKRNAKTSDKNKT
jgi:apolipoprotein N-acyltransferase